MRRLWVVLAAIVVVVLGAVILADRIAASVAAGKVAERLAEHRPFTEKPQVSIHGFPFLTQAMHGRYSDIEVSTDTADLSAGSVMVRAEFRADLRGVHLSAGDALSGSVGVLPVDRIDGQATVSYAELNRLLANRVRVSGADGRLTVMGDVTLPGRGAVTATGRLSVEVSEGRARLSVSDISVAGVRLPAALQTVAAQALSADFPLPALPYRLVLTSVRAGAEALVLSGHADHVVLLTTG